MGLGSIDLPNHEKLNIPVDHDDVMEAPREEKTQDKN